MQLDHFLTSLKFLGIDTFLFQQVLIFSVVVVVEITQIFLAKPGDLFLRLVGLIIESFLRYFISEPQWDRTAWTQAFLVFLPALSEDRHNPKVAEMH